MPPHTTRTAEPEDAAAVASLYSSSPLAAAPRTASAFELLLQTGHTFVIAEADGEVDGAVRWWADEGIGWFELLASWRPWAGAELVRAVERACQDRGIRLLRCRCPDEDIFAAYFARLGHLPIGRAAGTDGEPELLLERRLPLLTVREQRRADAAAIGAITGEDPWVFEQGALPGWFVTADGERIVGVVSCADAGRGLARVGPPVLLPAYRGRGIELWMIDRATEYAETNGFHTAELDAVSALEPLRKGLEDRYWVLDGGPWRRIFFTPKSDDEEDDW